MMQLVKLVAKHGKFQDYVRQKREFAQHAEGLQRRNLENVSRIQRLLRQSRVVDGLDEEQGQSVQEEITGQTNTDFAWEVLEVQ